MTKKALSLTVEKRTLTGKKVKQLRKNGIIPANLFGSKIKSVAIQVNEKDFNTIYKTAGQTNLVELVLSGEKKSHHVLINNPHIHPVTEEILHVDFREVPLTEKMKVEVPIAIVGVSPAAEKNIGVFLQLVNDLEVEALPTELPSEIEVDISGLAEVGDEIKVSDIRSGRTYTITADDETGIARINPLEKEEEPEPAVEVEGAEAETPTDGESAAQGETSKVTPQEESTDKKKE